MQMYLISTSELGKTGAISVVAHMTEGPLIMTRLGRVVAVQCER